MEKGTNTRENLKINIVQENIDTKLIHVGSLRVLYSLRVKNSKLNISALYLHLYTYILIK